MNHNVEGHNHEGFWHLVKGTFLGICIFIYRIWEGFIKHNGGYEELFYSLLTLIIFGFLGAGVSYYGSKFWKWMNK